MDDHRSAGINVKVYDTPRPGGLDKLTEEEANLVWERVTESFWIGLEGTVQSDGLAEHVYAEGRMGGWAVPDPAIAPGTPEWDKFAKIVEGEMDYYLNTVWPEAVAEEVERIEAERLRDDPWIEIKLRRSAVATVAGMVAETEDIQEIVGDEDGGAQDQITASTETWNEIRESFPLDSFKEHGNWFGKDEEE